MSDGDGRAWLEWMSTGQPKLDRLLGGGIPSESLTVVAGAPGTGKTIFALQMLFSAARQNKKCLYVTTLSEPAIKLLRYMQLFTFFDERLLDQVIVMKDLGTTLQSGGAKAAFAELSELSERVQPDMIVVDSFKAIHDLIADPMEGRISIHDAAVYWTAWGATTLLVGEYTADDIRTQPEFAIADGILEFSVNHDNLMALRQFEVQKLRGAAYVPGRHFLEITPNGMQLYPRIAAPRSVTTDLRIMGRIGSGVPGLDELFNGGLRSGTSVMVEGGTGTGKTLFGLHFALEGVRSDEPVLWITLEESAAQLRGVAASFGWDLEAAEGRGQLRILEFSRIEVSPEQLLDRVRDTVAEMHARRLVFDGLTAAAAGMSSIQRFQNCIVALVKHMQQAGVTLLLTAESVTLLGSAELSGLGLASVADSLLLFRYIEAKGHLERAVSLLKARGVRHTTELHQLRISDAGLEVGQPMPHAIGALTQAHAHQSNTVSTGESNVD